MIIEINDINATQLDIYARVNEINLFNRANPDEGIFIAESPKVVERALNAGYEPMSLLLERKHVEGEAKEIVERVGDIPVYVSSPEVLKQITGYELTRGVLCAMKRKPLPAIEDICRNAKRVAVMENVMNPTNVGAIFRSAAALNMDAVIVVAPSSNPLYRRAIRVSMGTVFQVPWTVIPLDDSGYVEKLKELGFTTIAMALTDESVGIDYKLLKELDKSAIILGTEGEGLLDSTIDKCDYTVKIPMTHGVDSLNVAAASAVAFWELGQRK